MVTADEARRPDTITHYALRITHYVFLALIMLGGLMLRLVFFWVSLPSGGAPFIRDESNYIGLAVPLSQGQGFVDKWLWLRPPGYPAFLASILTLSGGNFPLAALVQILLSVASIGMVYLLAVEVFARRPDVPVGKARAVGLVAAGLMAVNPHVVFYSNLLMAESPYMLAVTVVVWAMLRALRAWDPAPGARVSRRSLTFVVLAALATAVAALLRSLILTFIPLLLAWFWWVLPRSASEGRSALARRWSRGALVPIGVFVVVTFAAIAPWTVRNYLRYDRFLLVDTMNGYNLWEYNNDIGLDEVSRRLGQIPNPVDRANYSTQQGQAYILGHPLDFAEEALRRFADAWPVDHFSEYRLFFRDKYPGTDCTNLDIFAWLGTAFYVPFGLLAIWGIFLAPGRTFKGLTLLVLLHYAVSTLFAHAEFRYRLPLYPFLSVYAGWALVGAAWAFRARGRTTDDGRWTMRDSRHRPSSVVRRLAIPAAALVSLVFVVDCYRFVMPGLADSIRFERRYMAAKGELERGDYGAALADFMGAEQIDRACSALYRYVGLAQGKLGQADKERAAYTSALAREEQDWRTRALLSDRLRAAGDPHAPNPVQLTRPEFRGAQQRWAWEHLDPPKEPVVDVGGADIGYVRDFQSAESEKDAAGDSITYRWTTDHSEVRLPAPGGSGGLRLVIRLHSLAWPGKTEPDAQVRVLAGGREAGTITAHPGWEEASLDVPDTPGGHVIVLELLTTVERPPGGETRLLGVAVDGVRLERK